VTTTQETGAHVTPERIRADAGWVERAGFALVYECPLAFLSEDPRDADCPTMIWRSYDIGPWHIFEAGCMPEESEELEDRLLVESGFLEWLCDQIGDDQKPTENWREELRTL